MDFFLSDFAILRPEYESTQESTLAWLIKAHVEAEEKKRGFASEEEKKAFEEELSASLYHVACQSPSIAKRGHVFEDFSHFEWEKMQIYNLRNSPSGFCLGKRQKLFSQVTEKIFKSFYPEGSKEPDDLIHVTCTGYTAPSPAQMILSVRNWQKAHVTHAYHMGCYASIPAIRMARGFLSSGKKKADIVHTELCSLHSNPSLHNKGQLVAQSLFADGFIKYTLSKEKKMGFKVLALEERVIPSSLESMSWNLKDWGFEMYLAKEVPVFIAREVLSFLEYLCKGARLAREKLQKEAIFALHPGGPKIIDHVKKILQLEEYQLEKSRLILQKYGNMSSATLPHIWEEIGKDENIENKKFVVSLAFGPGLTICGAILQKQA